MHESHVMQSCRRNNGRSTRSMAAQVQASAALRSDGNRRKRRKECKRQMTLRDTRTTPSTVKGTLAGGGGTLQERGELRGMPRPAHSAALVPPPNLADTLHGTGRPLCAGSGIELEHDEGLAGLERTEWQPYSTHAWVGWKRPSSRLRAAANRHQCPKRAPIGIGGNPSPARPFRPARPRAARAVLGASHELDERRDMANRQTATRT